jgi:hypothetical protein
LQWNNGATGGNLWIAKKESSEPRCHGDQKMDSYSFQGPANLRPSGVQSKEQQIVGVTAINGTTMKN